MNRRKRTLFRVIAAVVIVVVAGFVINYIHSEAEYDIFKDHRELFEAVKNEAELLVGDQADHGKRDNIGNIFLYTHGGNAAADQFYDVMSASLQGKIQQIAVLSGDELSFLRYSKQEGKSLFRFVFDWERVYGNTYHIVYCESRDMVEKIYDGEPAEYVLHELDEGWYGIRIR